MQSGLLSTPDEESKARPRPLRPGSWSVWPVCGGDYGIYEQGSKVFAHGIYIIYKFFLPGCEVSYKQFGVLW